MTVIFLKEKIGYSRKQQFSYIESRLLINLLNRCGTSEVWQRLNDRDISMISCNLFHLSILVLKESAMLSIKPEL